MKNKTSAILTIVILANISVFAVEPKSKTASRLAAWQSAIKPDAPTSSRKQAVTAEPAVKQSSAPSYYSTARNVPPLPFNPFPELPLFDLGDHKYAFDDSEVDYDKLQAESRAQEAVKRSAITDSGGMMSAMMAGVLSVGITYDPPNSFLLDVFNMNPGGVYGIGAKASVDADPFNTWNLISVFEAQAADEQLAGSTSASSRFYTAVGLDSYAGPLVSIVSPAAGATLSGNVPLQVQVRDVLPLLSVRVYVGAILVGVVQPGQNGTVTLHTSWFPNGQHQIWAEAVNEGVPVDTDGDTVNDDISTFQGSGNVTVNFSNPVSMQNYSPLYSAAGSLSLQYSATSPQDYTFKVMRLNGDLLHTASGQSVNGSINPQWNYTDLTGAPVTDARYVFSLAHSPHSGGQISAAAEGSPAVVTTSLVDKGVSVGKYVVSYGEWPNSSFNGGLASMNAYVSVRVNSAALFSDDIVGADRENYGTIHADFTSDAFRIRKATQATDLVALKNALGDSIVGSWLFDGHTGVNNMIHGTDNYLTVDFTTQEVAAVLGNEYGSGPLYLAKYGRRLFSTIITGCSAVTGELPVATGTPHGVDQVGNSQIKKSAFFGFNFPSYQGPTKMNWINRLHEEWLDGNDYDTALGDAVDEANVALPEVLNWGPAVLGYVFLEYNANESR